jgi:hypothetical protein
MKNKLKKLAEEFDLKFYKNWFKHIWISKKENIFLEYIWMCPDPIYNKYGTDPYVRAKNIENFLSSEDFKKCLPRYGGQVIDKKNFKRYFLAWITKIENLEIMKAYKDIYNKINKSLTNCQKIAILTKSNKKNETEDLKSSVLLHEWIHVLLEENNLRIRDWKHNEGLVTYLESFSEEKLKELEKKVIFWKKYNFQKQYYIYAIKFRELLKNVPEPKRRKEEIINLRESLSK